MVHRHEFLRDYRLEVATEFRLDGQDARWASPTDGPRFWGQEDTNILLDTSDSLDDGRPRCAIAVTSDGGFLAAAFSSTIEIYEIGTQKLVSELKGHPQSVGKLVFVPREERDGERERTQGYTLLSVCPKVGGKGDTMIVWCLDDKGRQVGGSPFTPFGVNDLTKTAISAIATDLQQDHGVTAAELASIRSSLCAALTTVEKQHRLQNLPSTSGDLPNYNSTDLFSFSRDGTKVLYLSKNETTQHGMRPADELPQIVIANLVGTAPDAGDSVTGEHNSMEERHLQTLKVLQGHTDNILSVAFSPDGKLVASASWDQTFRIWSAETGECLHNIGLTGGQNWVVAFSSIGNQILLSGGNGRDKASALALYDTTTGEELNRLQHPGLDHWLRRFAIHPDGKSAAVVNSTSLLLWDFAQKVVAYGGEGRTSNAIEVLNLTNPEEDTSRGQARIFRAFASFIDVSWVDGGKKLLVRASDDTIFVWDREWNVKWRFQRPEGQEFQGFGNGFACVDDGKQGTVIALDGDGVVRFWQL